MPILQTGLWWGVILFLLSMAQETHFAGLLSLSFESTIVQLTRNIKGPSNIQYMYSGLAGVTSYDL